MWLIKDCILMTAPPWLSCVREMLLLVDDLDPQGACRADDALDDVLKRSVLNLEALVLGFHLCDLVHRSDGHLASCFVPCKAEVRGAEGVRDGGIKNSQSERGRGPGRERENLGSKTMKRANETPSEVRKSSKRNTSEDGRSETCD